MPRVSVIIPCYNEQATIGLLLEALLIQTYPRREFETIIADGMSSDRTRKVITDFQRVHPDFELKVVDNLKRIIPAALNRAIEAATGEFIIRLDAHSMPQEDYIARCVEALEMGKGTNVGGIWQIKPGGKGWIARSIASAASHPLGVGDARYRYAEKASVVDTVPFGAFRKELITQIGSFDETLLTNEDYEFNVRIRQSGGIVWLDPAIRSTYFARASLGELARQYWRYGFWKARMLRRYPESIRWRQAIPPLFVLSLLGLAILSIVLSPVRWILFGTLTVYFGVLLLASVQIAIKRRDPVLIAGVPFAIATIHICWGSALLWSLISFPAEKSTS